MATIKGASGREYEEWKPTANKETPRNMGVVNSQELERQNMAQQQTIVHLTNLINAFGFCRPETQLARMELFEASERYVLNRSYDDKNFGAIAKHLLKEMRAKGELPDEN